MTEVNQLLKENTKQMLTHEQQNNFSLMFQLAFLTIQHFTPNSEALHLAQESI